MEVSHRPNASASSSSSSRHQPTPSTSSSRGLVPLTPPASPLTHVQAIHDFDPALLASTSAAGSNIYLSFKAGEIIRVHVQDDSGWWDGEVTGEKTNGLRRGWFPSNYVKTIMGRPSSTRNDSISTTHTRTASATSHRSRASTSTLPENLQQLLKPVVEALSLLESAIQSNHKSHIQPSTACVISSIRSALQQSDCLSKESATLTKWPILGKERKIVLVELSRLVACARTASGAEGETENPEADMEALAKSARGVFGSVKRLLHMANECGVQPSSVPMRETASAPGDSRSLRAASMGDLRGTRKVSSPPPPMPSIRAASALGRARSPSIATPVSATFTSSSGRSTPVSERSRHHGSMDSSSTSHSSESIETTPVPPSGTFAEPQSAADVQIAIGAAEDALLSIIAAFIGHIHSHHISSHPSSHANLIEMTRETIDAVRSVLTIVEAVGRHPSVRETRSREIDQLRIAKDNLYEVASRLVEGAEVVANAETAEENYDQVKARLLQTATGTLRAGTECVRLVRQCVVEDVLTPRPPSTNAASRLVPDSSLVLRDKVVGERGMHTLSALHRKASSLGQLKKRYGASQPEEVVEEDEDLTMVTVRPDLLRTQSEDSVKARSRSSSLSSPAPPRMSHRSPSRSADLDKFTSDFTLPGRLPHASTLSVPATPLALADSPALGFIRDDSGIVDSLDTDATPGRRPSMAPRAVTAPLPSASTDVRFWVVAHDYDPKEICFNSEGNIIGASLAVLVEKMTPHDVPPEHTFWQTFFYTFRLFTTPDTLLQALIDRYDPPPPPHVSFGDRERAIWIERKVVPVRLRVYNVLRAWLETHWKPVDDPILDDLSGFSNVIARTLPAMAPRLQTLIRRRMSGPLSAISEPGREFIGLPPTPIISKSLNAMLLKHPSSAVVPIIEFDTLELARQLTLFESKLFCRVSPEDLLQTGKKTIPELRALSTVSNQITGWVADNVLNELDTKRRAGLLKFYIKLADKCLLLNNFSTLFALLAGLNSSIVTRLKKTWDALPGKYRLVLDRLQSVIDHSRNHATYRARLREVDGSCLPFLGLILTDITFTSDGNPDFRPSVLAPDTKLINQDKYTKLGKIAIDFAKYQQPFNFHELEQVQTFLRRALTERGSQSLDALYRKSLMLEPRKGAEKISSAVEKPGWLGVKI